MFDSSRIEFVFDKDCYTDEYFTSNIKITRLKESSKEFTIYLSIINDGFIYTNYCLGGNGERQYFSDDNGKRIDTMRTTIENWKQDDQISDNLYYFLLFY